MALHPVGGISTWPGGTRGTQLGVPVSGHSISTLSRTAMHSPVRLPAVARHFYRLRRAAFAHPPALVEGGRPRIVRSWVRATPGPVANKLPARGRAYAVRGSKKSAAGGWYCAEVCMNEAEEEETWRPRTFSAPTGLAGARS